MGCGLLVGCGLLIGCPGEPAAPGLSPDGSSGAAATDVRDDEPLGAEALLERIVRERCLDPADPWALAHGLLVYGRDLRLSGGLFGGLSGGLPGGRPGAGDLAIERLVLDNVVVDERGGARRLSFPSQRDGRPIEPHPGMFVKTLIEVGVAASYRLPLPGGERVTLEALARMQVEASLPALGRAPPLPFHNQAWLLEVLAFAGPEAEVARLGAQALEVLDRNQAYLETYLADPARPYHKPWVDEGGRRAPAEIHRYYCGGLHFFQAVQRLHGVALPERLARQYELLLLRIEKETDYWDRALAQATDRFAGAELAAHARIILTQKLKLQGHALEAALRAVDAGALTLSPSAAAQVEAGFGRLEETVLALERFGIYRDLDRIRAAEPQIYLDLVGDSAHALHAYRLR